ncbi:hypothetical protein [Zoogloea sp.]|uniref:hypothetical protein n=1 Tax=Zoogloea sp. TaxID=49181 RepID=UPI0035B1E519
MGLFKSQGTKTAKVYWARNWDERLYKALFAHTTEMNLKLGHHFGCLLNKRSSKIDLHVSPVPIHTYQGTFRLWLNETEHCEIPLQVSFEDSHNHYDVFINGYTLGCFSFYGQILGDRPHAAMTIIIRNEAGLSDHVAKLFAEIKAAGGNGLSIGWSAILKDMVGLSAEQVWGNWKEHIEFNHDEKGTTALPVGRQLFSLESLSFEAEL